MLDAILICGGGLMQVPAVTIAQDMGLHTIVTDARADAPAMQNANTPIALDIYDVEGHLRLVEKLQSEYNLRGVFSEGADVEVTVAAAADHAKLPGIPIEAAINTKNKVKMRSCLDRAGIPNPPWAEVDNLADGLKAAERIGFPLMVKAVDNCASRGTMRVDMPGMLGEAIEQAKANSTTSSVLIEGYFQGEEQSVEILFDETGRCHYLNIVDRLFVSEGNYAIEMGHINPTKLNRDEQEVLFKLAERASAAAGINFGAFKADTIMTQQGPRILEATARLSGGFDCQYTTPLSSGRNFIRAAMRLAIGVPLDENDLRHKWHKYAAAWVALPKPGKVVEISGVKQAMKIPGVKHVFLRVGVSDVINPYHDCAARPAFVIASGDTRMEAINNAQSGISALCIETEACKPAP